MVETYKDRVAEDEAKKFLKSLRDEDTSTIHNEDVLAAERKLTGKEHTVPLAITAKMREAIYGFKRGAFDQREAEELINGLIAMGDKSDGVDALVFLEDIYKANEGRNLPDLLTQYILSTSGWFDVRELDKECKILTKQDKDNRRQILHRFVDKGILERHPTKNGLYRLVQKEAPEIDWFNADISNIYHIKFPFKLEEFVVLYPKNIVVIAAPPNAGKTAFLLNVIKLNCDKLKVHYFSSEMGAEELKVRLNKFDDMAENDWTFSARERSSNFADVIAPDDCNIIDYIEMPEGDFFRMSAEIKAIFDKLRKGIAIIALQKKAGVDYGRGGELSAEKARLYLTMENNVLKIKKGKNWAKEGVNPNNMEFHYSLVKGAKFIEEGNV